MSRALAATIGGLALLVALTAVLMLPAREADDPFLWLEDVVGTEALAWVEARNARTLAELSAHPAHRPIYERLRAIHQSQERIPMPTMIGSRIYNFWQDAVHPRGLWRRASWESYTSGTPQWEALLDLDALSDAENISWAFGGAACLPPEHRLCLLRLSRGGSDAVEIREFDVETRTFVEGGFVLPEAKQSAAWVDEAALLVATEAGTGSMTTSGYARIAKLWRRGTSLADASPLFEAAADDVGVWVGTLGTGDRVSPALQHRTEFYKERFHLLRGGSLVPIELPLDATPHLSGEWLVVYARSPWTIGEMTHPGGSILATRLDAFLDGARDFEVVLAPSLRDAVENVATTRDHLLVSLLSNVRGELRVYRRDAGRWVYESLSPPDMGSVRIAGTSPYSNRYFLTYSGYTQPTTLYAAEDAAAPRPVIELPAMFDARGLVVDQHEAVSADGTRIPYFLVARDGLPLDGTNPTLLYAYGGFEVSLTPSYSATTGAAWLERGGVYAVANIRGGGELGPAWHRAGLKEHRQRIYDDFLAVAEDLVARRVTSPRHLGIQGGSNGGLLTGVAYTQRPDLFGAVVSAVPLFDMRRYHLLLAGASWMAEYGNPDLPEEWAYISRYSPYQNIRPGQKYPTVLFTTTTRDDRVHPGHARKGAARMESLGYPVYYFENTEGGHGSGVTAEQRARMDAVVFTYLWQQLDRTGAERP